MDEARKEVSPETHVLSSLTGSGEEAWMPSVCTIKTPEFQKFPKKRVFFRVQLFERNALLQLSAGFSEE